VPPPIAKETSYLKRNVRERVRARVGRDGKLVRQKEKIYGSRSIYHKTPFVSGLHSIWEDRTLSARGLLLEKRREKKKKVG